MQLIIVASVVHVIAQTLIGVAVESELNVVYSIQVRSHDIGLLRESYQRNSSLLARSHHHLFCWQIYKTTTNVYVYKALEHIQRSNTYKINGNIEKGQGNRDIGDHEYLLKKGRA